MKTYFISILVFFFLFAISAHPTYAYPWSIKSIDTMKLSRDGARNPQIDIAFWVKKVASLHANYIAIDTPYDREFAPVLAKWVQEARKNHLHVWFRGNFSGWEGWFGYLPITVQQHYQKTQEFITSHPEFFAEGDIFTAAPEPENGIIGDPRSSPEVAQKYKTFLVTSYNTCAKAFAMLKKHVSCGYYSVNGDIALHILDQTTIDKTGNIVVIDHYVHDSSQMSEEINALHRKFHAKIIIGEFGAPIPDITGNMTDSEQEKFVSNILATIAAYPNIVTGFNYWVVAGGTTALVQENGINKLVASAIDSYFDPVTIQATILDFKKSPIKNKKIHTSQGDTYTNKNGVFTITFPKGKDIHVAITGNTKPVSLTLRNVQKSQALKPIILRPNAYTFWQIVQIWWENIVKFFSRQ